MDNGDKPRPVAPPEPISPALSSTAIPKTSISRVASPANVPTPDSTRAIVVKSPVPESAPGNESTGVPLTSAPQAASSTTMPRSPLPSTSTSAPTMKEREPSPAIAIGQINGRKISIGDGEAESELSDPASTVHSPSGADFNELEDEIVVGARTNGIRKSSPIQAASEPDDETMADVDDEPVASHYPKRKRTSIFHDLSERKIIADDRQSSAAATKAKSSRSSSGGIKGVVIGYWRDSTGPTKDSKHAVIGFIDVRERLRTRIQANNIAGEPMPDEYPLPPGPGGSWVTFERIVFLDHLVNLDHLQIKEYVKIRSEKVGTDETESEKAIAEVEAVKEACRRARLNPVAENAANPPQVAYGLDLPEHMQRDRDPKRRRTSGAFAPANTVPSNGPAIEHTPIQPAPGGPQPVRNVVDPLPGTRPTRILIGHWAKSDVPNSRDRHAVYGILGQNDMFRVKLVRETRDGRVCEANFPQGAGALWIPYEEVEFEPHLRSLARNEVKEYCRVRQWQIDRGETADEITANEARAVYEAQARIAGTNQRAPAPLSIAPALPRRPDEYIEEIEQNGRYSGGHELRQSRRVEAARAEARPTRQFPVDFDNSQPLAASRSATNKPSQNNNALERTSALAEREISRVELAQERAHLQAVNRERAAAAAAQATAAAAATISGLEVNGRQQLHERDEVQRLNKVWARQESLRMRTNADDAKMFGGIKYERKANGPFTGKLVSQGTIINIDGEDYVEYRVLTRPSFF
ncbi:hypothetical protein FGRMN_5701 [Fusarium graminum]|nr:hypothetical protein FGRMN_5701 [Fusarium graminum]